ncbi:hypothetical protein [Oryzihumus leptocrescens]|uniref:HipA-like protein n=1 Tax=Oryzihumus leptocrescens TaxID=297536 RepID=A0A542ZEK8_9MICO|nr:hypothetical protein [Oryzihumus leptocrescens]TQL58782.1 hypothetical protein FB474_0120 [Oryzihumus leptocrescens]
MTDQAWERRDVTQWPIREIEQAGSHASHWLQEPETGQRWLHKDTLIPANGVEQGEDWSEVVSTQVAILLGVPCASTRLCVRNGRRGSISRSVRPSGHDLNEGRVLLERAQAPGYFAHEEGSPGIDPERPDTKRPGHNLINIRDALHNVDAPPGFNGPETCGAFEVFAGYLLLDALIANRDRHEHNWAVLTPQLTTSPERLSPTYDHASSLGYNLSDIKRKDLLARPSRLRGWAEKGTAWRFEHTEKPPSLVQLAAQALLLCSREGANWWHGRLQTLDLTPVLGALRERAIPGMSEPASRFAHDLLVLNLGRLRDAVSSRA